MRVRVAKLFKETKSGVKVGEKVGDCFLLARGVREGCLISPDTVQHFDSRFGERNEKEKMARNKNGNGRDIYIYWLMRII